VRNVRLAVAVVGIFWRDFQTFGEQKASAVALIKWPNDVIGRSRLLQQDRHFSDVLRQSCKVRCWELTGPNSAAPEGRLLTQPGPTGMSSFAAPLGDKRTSILPHMTASVCSAFSFALRA